MICKRLVNDMQINRSRRRQRNVRFKGEKFSTEAVEKVCGKPLFHTLKQLIIFDF